MYLREFERAKGDKTYAYWGICETVRTERGPRQRLVSYLGDINTGEQERWHKSIRLAQEGEPPQELRLYPDTAGHIPNEPDAVRVRMKGIRWERPRDFGDVYAAWMLWKRLSLDEFYRERLDERECDADIPWTSPLTKFDPPLLT